MRFRGRTRILTTLTLAGLALTACATGSAGPAGTTPAAPSQSTLTPTSPAPTLTPTATPSTTRVTSPKPTRSTTPTPTRTSTAPTLPADYCQASQLTIRVLPGGAYQNYEIAAVAFTNTSGRSCSLAGYPAVELLRGGQTLVTASANQARPAKLVHLAPGVQAEAQIRDHTTCQAPLSDAIHVSAPDPLSALTLDRPNFQMRGCTVTVDPIVLSS